jgi:hypothetical protein
MLTKYGLVRVFRISETPTLPPPDPPEPEEEAVVPADEQPLANSTTPVLSARAAVVTVFRRQCMLERWMVLESFTGFVPS